MWIQNGCKVYMGSYMASNGSRFMVTWTIFKSHLLEGRPNTKLGDYGTPNAHDRWFILFNHLWRPARIEMDSNSIWLRVRSHMASHYTWGFVTILHEFGGILGRLRTFCFGLSQFHGHGSWLVCEVALSWASGLMTCQIFHLFKSEFKPRNLWHETLGHIINRTITLGLTFSNRKNLWLVIQ